MSNYGRNFEFRVPPRAGERAARHVLTSSDLSGLGRTGADLLGVVIGAPVRNDNAYAGTSESRFTGADDVKLAYNDKVPVSGLDGILVYEHGPAAYAGNDPEYTTYSDIDKAPVGKLCQVVSGTTVKVVFRNTAARTFLHTRTYAARTMVAGIGIATPTLIVGDYLGPGAGTDAGGYWKETSLSNAWLVVTAVDNARAEVEARMLF